MLQLFRELTIRISKQHNSTLYQFNDNISLYVALYPLIYGRS
jgi:hypothetical protein